jgi:hypothetical protein
MRSATLADDERRWPGATSHPEVRDALGRFPLRDRDHDIALLD